MEIEVRTVGSRVPVGSLAPFTFFEWNRKLYLKMRDRNRNITDIWDIADRKPEWIMPSTEVRTVSAVGQISSLGTWKAFQDVPDGEIFRSKGVEYFKARPASYEPETQDGENAYCISSASFLHIDGIMNVTHPTSKYVIIRAEE